MSSEPWGASVLQRGEFLVWVNCNPPNTKRGGTYDLSPTNFHSAGQDGVCAALASVISCVRSLRSFSAFLLCVSSFQLCPCFVKLNHKNLTRRLPEIRSRRTHEPKPSAQKEYMMRVTGLPYRPADAPE